MKNYIPYTVIALIILVGSIFYITFAKKGTIPTNNKPVDHSAMGHETGTSPIAQSHRSYDVQMTSDTNTIKPGVATKITFKIVNDKKEVVKRLRRSA